MIVEGYEHDVELLCLLSFTNVVEEILVKISEVLRVNKGNCLCLSRSRKKELSYGCA